MDTFEFYENYWPSPVKNERTHTILPKISRSLSCFWTTMDPNEQNKIEPLGYERLGICQGFFKRAADSTDTTFSDPLNFVHFLKLLIAFMDLCIICAFREVF